MYENQNVPLLTLANVDWMCTIFRCMCFRVDAFDFTSFLNWQHIWCLCVCFINVLFRPDYGKSTQPLRTYSPFSPGSKPWCMCHASSSHRHHLFLSSFLYSVYFSSYFSRTAQFYTYTQIYAIYATLHHTHCPLWFSHLKPPPGEAVPSAGWDAVASIARSPQWPLKASALFLSAGESFKTALRCLWPQPRGFVS